ncbi:recombinase family protein [Aeromicrobium sp. Leaf291]|uniref:recombinase family protein n=1 Tax=Aeromicrobium sp. Leaf291 TaxID=1736325 RepID=UPI0007008365|nr:recombinase family protein [Aeromicrobium sp. Leaf291]KQP81636.1 hypothetical protein ASF35_16535 [Aeromicrobium sp. Leaf291]
MRPFGYERDRFHVREAEAALIREAADSVLKGSSIRAVTTDWNDRGVVTPGGNTWRPVVLKRLLVSLRAAGKRENPDGAIVDGGWPAILDDDTHRQLVTLLNDEARSPAPAPKGRSYLLTGGLATCGLCGADLIARPDNKGQRGYVCSSGSPTFGCGKIRINGHLLEEEVANRALARLLREDARERLAALAEKAQERAKVAEATLADVKLRQAQLGEDYAAGNLTGSAARAATEKLAERSQAARRDRQLAADLENVAFLEADDLVEWWEGASLGQQRTLLSLLLSGVAVHPAPVVGSKTFDPSRVKVRWRR